ncbi:MAG: polysaccharide biosynthesis/export family protein [Acidobacteriota bacterium]
MIRRIEEFSLFSLLIGLILVGPVIAQQPAPSAVPPIAKQPAAIQPIASQPITGQDATKTPAQQSTLQTIPPATGTDDQAYRIGPGDLIDIRVFGRPELTREARVDSYGRIRLPFIEEMQAGCLTETQLATAITERYKKYLRDPQVDVLIKDYRSQPVAVIGAVAHPGRFQLQRRVRLLELVTFAGGPSNQAGSTIRVIHSADHEYCTGAVKEQATQQADTAEVGASDATLQFSAINLRDLLAGNPNANPYIQPGDIISIPEADQFFVTGSVVKPGAYALNNKMTLTQAIGMAGGINMEGAKNRIRLVRPVPGTEQRKETIYNIDDILKRKTADIALMPNDIIEVPGSTARAAQRNLLGVSISMLSALPFFILR